VDEADGDRRLDKLDKQSNSSKRLIPVI
jgi:hypothetical protein